MKSNCKCCLGKWASQIKVNYETSPASCVSGIHDGFKSRFPPNSGAFSASYLLAHQLGDPQLLSLSAGCFLFLPFLYLAPVFLKNPSIACLFSGSAVRLALCDLATRPARM